MVLDFERRRSRVWTVEGNRVSPDQRTPGERYDLALADDVIEYRACRSTLAPVGGFQRRQGHVPSQSKRKTWSHTTSRLVLMASGPTGRKETFSWKETGVQFTYIELVDELLNGFFVASEVLWCRRHSCNARRGNLDEHELVEMRIVRNVNIIFNSTFFLGGWGRLLVGASPGASD
jgi:hypothetical protein